MANFRNDTGTPGAARSGESVQEVRDRWAGEVNPSTLPQDQSWNEPWTPMDTRLGMPPMASQMGQMNNGGMQMDQMASGVNQQMNDMWMNQGDMNAGMQMPTGTLQMSRSGQPPQRNDLNMRNNLPDEVIESPTTVNEAYLGSLKATLLRNKGNYIVATFLVGTQNTVSWEGILYEVGNDYVTIYQPGRDRYIVNDMYSLRYMEFYDTRKREMCDRLLQNQGWQNGTW